MFIIFKIFLDAPIIIHSVTACDLRTYGLPQICYDKCNYGNPNIRCCAQVSVRIMHYLCITKKENTVPGFAGITNARRHRRSICMR